MARINEVNKRVDTPIVDGGIRSGVNSSTTALNNGETFTGTAELNKHTDVMVWVSTDQNGVIYAEFSQDGTNWDTSLSFNYNTSRINPPHVLVKGYRFFRARFTNNSGSNQTYFRLGTYYGSFQKLTAPINGTLAENYDAIVTRPTDYRYEVAESKRQGRTTWNKFGYNPSVASSTEEVIASFGGAFTKLPAADTIDFVSTSASDTLVGVGAQRIVVTGVDGNWNQIVEVVELDGTNPVTTSNEFLGVNRCAIFKAGSSEVNVGDITGTGTTISSTTLAQIPAGSGTTEQAIFYVQQNHNFLADSLFLNVNKLSGGTAPRLTIRGYVYSSVSTAVYEVFREDVDTSIENTIIYNPSQPFIIGEKSILYFTADTNTNNTVVNIRFSGIESRIS